MSLCVLNKTHLKTAHFTTSAAAQTIHTVLDSGPFTQLREYVTSSTKLKVHNVCIAFSAGASGWGTGGLTPTRKIAPLLGGAAARVFPNVSFAMCPLKLALAPLLARLAPVLIALLAEDRSMMAGNNGRLKTKSIDIFATPTCLLWEQHHRQCESNSKVQGILFGVQQSEMHVSSSKQATWQ